MQTQRNLGVVPSIQSDAGLMTSGQQAWAGVVPGHAGMQTHPHVGGPHAVYPAQFRPHDVSAMSRMPPPMHLGSPSPSFVGYPEHYMGVPRAGAPDAVMSTATPPRLPSQSDAYPHVMYNTPFAAFKPPPPGLSSPSPSSSVAVGPPAASPQHQSPSPDLPPNAFLDAMAQAFIRNSNKPPA